MAAYKQFPVLETIRLGLRAFSIEDAPRVQELAGDYEVAKTTLNIRRPRAIPFQSNLGGVSGEKKVLVDGEALPLNPLDLYEE